MPSSERSLSQILSCTSNTKGISERDLSEKVRAHSLIKLQSFGWRVVQCTKVAAQSLVEGHTSIHK